MRVYVCGPFTHDSLGDVVEAQRAAEAIREMGHQAFVPFIDRLPGRSPLQWLSYCQAMLRLKGETLGPDLETRYAKRRGMPIYDGVDEIP